MISLLGLQTIDLISSFCFWLSLIEKCLVGSNCNFSAEFYLIVSPPLSLQDFCAATNGTFFAVIVAN